VRFIQFLFVIFLVGLSNTSWAQSECIDTDGDGWGWDGQQSCRAMDDDGQPMPIQHGECIDADGDGWGWDGTQTCDPNQNENDDGNDEDEVINDPPVVVNPIPDPPAAFQYPPRSTNLPSSRELNMRAPTFGQTIVGDVPNTTIRGVSLSGERHQYSRRTAWNSDETILYIGEKAYRTANLSLVRDLNTMMSTEWYASHKDPDVIYGTKGSGFYKGNVSTGRTELIVDVGERIWLGQWEGGISSDDSYAVVNNGQRLYVIDILNREVISGPHTVSGALDNADISHDGKYVTWISGGTTYYSDINFKNVVKANFGSNHSDLCVDVNGDQVYVMFTGAYEIAMIRLKDNLVHRKKILYTGNGHLSCTNFKRPGYVYMSTYRGANGPKALSIQLDYSSTPTYEDWGFTREYQFVYDGSNYDQQAKLAASPSGTQLIFTSTWNQSLNFRDFVISYDQKN